MFRSEGAARSHRLNQVLAGYLAFLGGYVNAVGFVRLGLFTSHMSGNIARGVLDVARGDVGSARQAALLVVSFFGGAFGAHLVLEARRLGAVPRRYALALAFEALLLAGYAVAGEHALVLAAAMGLQNSLVTRLSGAIVRTTHLTGVVTDLGIEAARWLRYGVVGGDRPPGAKLVLLGTIAAAFALGALGGSLLTLRFAVVAIAVPIALLVAFAASALRQKT